MQAPAVGARQQELEQQASEVQHLQQEVARLRQERDAARLQIGSTSSKQAINTKPGGVPCHQPLPHICVRRNEFGLHLFVAA